VMAQGSFYLIGMIHAVEKHVAVNLAQARLNSLKNLHEEERREERDDRHNGIRPFARESARIRMRSIIETIGNAKNSLARFR